MNKKLILKIDKNIIEKTKENAARWNLKIEFLLVLAMLVLLIGFRLFLGLKFGMHTLLGGDCFMKKLFILAVVFGYGSLTAGALEDLHEAIRMGNLRNVKLAIQSKADINGEQDGYRSISLAAFQYIQSENNKQQYLEILKFLMLQKPNLNFTDTRDFDPIKYVLLEEKGVEALKILLSGKVGIDHPTDYKNSYITTIQHPGELASQKLKLLLGKNVYIGKKGEFVLLYFTYQNPNMDCIKLLLQSKHSLELNIPEPGTELARVGQSYSNLIIKMEGFSKEIFDLMLQKGYDPNFHQPPLLPTACSATELEDAKLAIMILGKIKNLQQLDCIPSNKVSLLHYAVYIEKPEIVKYLLARRMDKKAKDKQGKTPMDYARSDGLAPDKPELIKILK